MSRHAAKQHRKAATHNTRAAEHHKEASLQYEQGNQARGAYHAQTALGHELHAREAANEASKHHARNDMDEDYGNISERDENEEQYRSRPDFDDQDEGEYEDMSIGKSSQHAGKRLISTPKGGRDRGPRPQNGKAHI